MPDVVDLKVDARTYDPAVREQVVRAVKRVVRGESDASGLLREPQITQTDDIPAVINDEHVVEKLINSFGAHFDNCVSEMVRDTGSDDFSVFASELEHTMCVLEPRRRGSSRLG